MGRLLLLLFTVLCSVLYAETALDITTKRLLVRKLESCKGERYLPMIFQNLTVTKNVNSDGYEFEFEVIVKKQISKNLAIVLSLSKCDASGNPDSCEYVVKDYNATNVCELITMKDELWSNFVEHFEPPLVCPIKPGVYKMVKCPVDSKSLEYLPLSDAVWKVLLTGWDSGKKVACVEFEEQIIASYKRGK